MLATGALLFGTTQFLPQLVQQDFAYTATWAGLVLSPGGVVSETCLYSLPEQRLGQIPGSGGAARLQKMVGITRAKDIVMRSRRIPGRQAYEWGVATDCVADDELEAASDGLAEELRGFPPLAQRSAKKLINDIEDAGLSLAIELEGQCYGRLRGSDDFREGVEAFHQKRRPEFRGK